MCATMKDLYVQTKEIEEKLATGQINPDAIKDYLMAHNAIRRGIDAGRRLIEASYARE
ncbi:MAG: hypothetical protein NTZ10_01325 [Candidatus Saganbacteria bacterium]|nr:hypothetical protein [Candidatus Saganbacteria bacterium]